MFKMHYFSKNFQKSLIINYGDLKLRDLAKLFFTSWLWRKRT